MEEFDILVRNIKLDHTDNSKVVFDAVVLEWRPIKKEWQQTKKRITCVGYFYNLVENDHLHVNAEEIEDPIYGTQWQIYVSERVEPGTTAEMLKFLSSVKGVGTTTARTLVDWSSQTGKGQPLQCHRRQSGIRAAVDVSSATWAPA